MLRCGTLPEPRRARFTQFVELDGRVIDHGIVLFFPAPNSFTGEDVVELQGHGSPVVMARLIAHALALGARMARPGEFSERAFLNERMDLLQAEAIADLIDSSTAAAAHSAMRSLSGEFSARVHELVEAVTRLRVFVEAAIDFPEEEIDFLANAAVMEQLEQIVRLFAQIRRSASQGRMLRDGIKLVLTGPPNAGKSSLLNRLCNEDRAIVSTIPGTTRDVLSQMIDLDGLPVEIVDTAGIRDTEELIEAEGVRRALAARSDADIILHLLDSTASQIPAVQTGDTFPNAKTIQVYNKIDLLKQQAKEALSDTGAIGISALTGEGLDELRHAIKTAAGFRDSEDSLFIARQRHLDAIARAEACLHSGIEQQKSRRAGELLAEELRACQHTLGEVTGEVSSDDLLGRIFSSFCIGK